MDVIISIDVRRTIDEYANALMYYPITRNRARQKVDNLTATLEALGSSIVTPAICMSKDLLQTFDAGGNPRIKNLRRFNYRNQSGFTWSFACLYDYVDDSITILKMMAATFVKESVEELMRPILEFNERLMAVR